MTRGEEIRNEAHNRYCNAKTDPVDSAGYCAFVGGARWADKSMIERARKWLEKELYLFYSGAEHWVASQRKVNVTEFLDDFEIAMQDE